MQLYKISLWSLVVLLFPTDMAMGVGDARTHLSKTLPRKPSKRVVNRVINNILNSTKPRVDDMKMLKVLPVADRRAVLKEALTLKCTSTPCLIRNPSIFPEDIAAICTIAYKGTDPIMQKHNKDYYFGQGAAEDLRSIQAQYRSLAYVIDGPDIKVPAYITATQQELSSSATKAVADAYFY